MSEKMTLQQALKKVTETRAALNIAREAYSNARELRNQREVEYSCATAAFGFAMEEMKRKVKP